MAIPGPLPFPSGADTVWYKLMHPALLIPLFLVFGTALVWKGSAVLESASESLSHFYRLPPTVHGAIVVAVGSSFPEFSSTVLSTLLHGDFELGLSVVVGSAIFNILVIPAVSGLAGGGMRTGRDVVFKEGLFYFVSVAVLLLTFSLAVIYNPIEGEPLLGRFTRALALIPVLLYVLYIFIQQQDVRDHRAEPEPARVRPLAEWGKLIASLALILAGVEALVRAAITLGDLLGTPSFIWGVTIIAAVTSLPDTFVSVRLARRDEGVVSLSNVLGSNIFDLLVALPAGVLIAGATAVNFGVAVPLMAVLTLSTIVLFATMRTDLRLDHRESVLLLGTYALFVLWIVLESVGVTGLTAG